MFEAMPHALLEIHTGMMASAILSDTIPCDRLSIREALEPLSETIEPEFSQKKVLQESLVTMATVAVE